MRIFFGYLGLYFTIIFGSLFIAHITKKKVEKVIPVNFCANILLLYIFGAFDILKAGLYITIAINVLLGIYTIFKEKKNLKETLATPGFVFFSICYFVLMLTTYNKQLVDWDHFTYRSLNAKIMYYTDTMVKGYTYFYPPAPTL